MIKKEIAEIKRQFTPANCSISRICGCYVDGEKNKKAEFKEAFLSLPEEDMFKYFELLRKNLSGTLGKNLINLEFPLAAEEEGGPHEFLLKLRGSRLQDDALLDAFYDRIIENYDYVGNYLILLIHDPTTSRERLPMASRWRMPLMKFTATFSAPSAGRPVQTRSQLQRDGGQLPEPHPGLGGSDAAAWLFVPGLQ